MTPFSSIDRPLRGGSGRAFQDLAFIGLSVAKQSDTFLNGGVTDSLVGDALTIQWGGGGGVPANAPMSAVFNFSGFSTGGGGGAVPLPAGAWAGLIGMAACGLVAAARGRWWLAAT
jgi:hypothetical protein